MGIQSYGTEASDGFRVGSYRDKIFNFGVPGLSLSPRISYAIKPASSPVIVPTGSAVAGAGQVTLTPSAPNKFVTYQEYSNVLELDVCRGIIVEVATITSAVTLTISGWDFWGHKVVENIAISGVDIFYSKKTYSHIKSIYTTGAIASFSIAGSKQFGLPFYVPGGGFVRLMSNSRPDYCISYTGAADTTYPFNYSEWPNTGGSDGSGFQVGDTTSPATATTGDPRGFWAPSSSIDGSNFVVMMMYVPGFDPMAGTVTAPSINNPSQQYCYGVTQFSEGWR